MGRGVGLIVEAGCKPKSRTLAGFNVNANLAPHHLNDLFGYRQSQSSADGSSLGEFTSEVNNLSFSFLAAVFAAVIFC